MRSMLAKLLRRWSMFDKLPEMNHELSLDDPQLVAELWRGVASALAPDGALRDIWRSE